MNDDKITIEIINGSEGQCVVINNYRVAGPKPWGGGFVEKSWTASKQDILTAIGIKTNNI